MVSSFVTVLTEGSGSSTTAHVEQVVIGRVTEEVDRVVVDGADGPREARISGRWFAAHIPQYSLPGDIQGTVAVPGLTARAFDGNVQELH